MKIHERPLLAKQITPPPSGFFTCQKGCLLSEACSDHFLVFTADLESLHYQLRAVYSRTSTSIGQPT